MPRFFGLTPSYRNIIFQQIFDLVYHGGGGFIHSEVYNMPVWMRRYHIDRINEFNKKQNEELEKIQGRSNIGDGDISRPNVDPSMFYFNK